MLQIEEEEHLIAELKKIELRKKEREKKTQDLQKLITAADSNIDSRKADKRQTKKKIHLQQKFKEVVCFNSLFVNLQHLLLLYFYFDIQVSDYIFNTKNKTYSIGANLLNKLV